MWDSGHTRKAHKSRPSASESCRKGDVPELTLSAINRRDPYSDGTIRNSRIAPSYRKILAQSHSAHPAGIIPTAAAFDSFWDSQIGETLTRCLLLREEQHRWVERLGSYGLIGRQRSFV